MSEIFAIGVMGILWIVNLFNGTGLDQVYHVTDIFKYSVIIIAIAIFFLRAGDKEKRQLESYKVAVFGGMLGIFIISSAFHHTLDSTLDYIWVMLLTMVLAELKITSKVFYWTGIIFGIFGAFVLVIYNYGTLFSGWNENSIAMLGMHSYLMFIIPFSKHSKKFSNIQNNIIIILSTCIFAYLLQVTDSRSATLFLIIAALLALDLIPKKIVVCSKSRTLIMLLIPLVIAIVVALMTDSNLTVALNEWSLEKFQKSIFNGRDELWKLGFSVFKDYPIIGTGNISLSRWHNSAITCLTTYGCLGFILWIKSFHIIIEDSRRFFDDYFISGTVISFFVLYVQQSVELGFISSAPSFIPYIMLGMMVGRVNYLKDKRRRVKSCAAEYNYSRL